MPEKDKPPAAEPKAEEKATPSLAERLAKGGKASPHELAQHCGFVTSQLRRALVDGLGADQAVYTWQHNAAAALHGWGAHEYHAGKPFELTLDAYKSALQAVEGPGENGHYMPVKGALSPHCKHLVQESD